MQCCALPFDFLESLLKVAAFDPRVVLQSIFAPYFAMARRRRGKRRADGRAVEGRVMKSLMGQTQAVSRLAGPARAIGEDIAIEHRHDTFQPKALSAPAHSGADGVGDIAYRQRLRMSAISPIGVEEPDGAMLVTDPRRLLQVALGIVVPADQGLPGRSPGTDVERNAGPGEERRFLLERMLRFIAPIHSDHL